MANQSAAPTGRRWTPPNHDGIDDDQVIDVDLDATDVNKSVQVGRSEQRPTRQPTQRQAPAGGDEDDNDHILKQRKIQQRLTRERLATERRVRQEFANEQALTQRQLAQKDQEIAQLRTKRYEPPNDAAHQSMMDSLQAQLEAAWEKGDSKEAAKIQRSMTEKQSEFESKKLAALLGNQQPAARAQPVQQQQQAPAAGGGMRPEAKRWASANPWFNSAGYEVESAAVIAADNELIARGSDPDDPVHYERIARVVKGKLPSIEEYLRSPDDRSGRDPFLDGLVDDDELDQDLDDVQVENVRQAAKGSRRKEVDDGGTGEGPRKKAGRAPVVNNGDETRDAGGQQRRNKRETITAEEAREMSKYGLDATDPKVANAYVRERRMQEERDAR